MNHIATGVGRPANPPDREEAAGGTTKRVFDLVAAGVALVLLAPVFLAVAVLIKLDSRGPVFFRQVRVGRNRSTIRMWKFRKMYHEMPVQGPSLTGRHDPRLTRVGRVLERTKLDELPQLFNVLAGDMSLVGPRPEVPRFVGGQPEWDAVLAVKPGIVGPSQLVFRNESELYPDGCRDVEGYYVQHILPPKLAIDAAYAARWTVWGDLVIMARTVLVALSGVVTWRTLQNRRWQILNTLVLSVLGMAGTAACAALVGPPADATLGWLLLFAAVAKPACIIGFQIPKALATSVGAGDLVRCVWCAAASGSLIVCGLVFSGFRDVSRVVLLADTGAFFIGLILYKLICYHVYVTFVVQQGRALSRRLIVASVASAPVGMAAVLVSRYGPGGSGGMTPEAMLTLVLAALVIRPLAFLFHPVDEPRGRSARTWGRLAFCVGIGSALILSAALLLNERGVGRRDLVIDATTQFLVMGLVTARYRRSVAAAPPAPAGSAAGCERLLVVGSGLELGAYLTALSALPEHAYRVVGAVSPHPWDRTNTVGGLPFLGGLTDTPDLVRVHGITQIVVLDDCVNDHHFDRLRDACGPDLDRVVRIQMLRPVCG
jgi:lipopolysaccharide/colanic/teichoic acid biosynthesis glycosyltransferase